MNHNPKEVLNNVEKYLGEIDTYRDKFCQMEDVYEELGIFDWFKNYLTKTDLKGMRKFLREAIKLGYTGYVCFKVGTSGCANGMWAYKAESTTGYSPVGECLYKSFTPDYEYWCVEFADGIWSSEIKTINELEEVIQKRGNGYTEESRVVCNKAMELIKEVEELLGEE